MIIPFLEPNTEVLFTDADGKAGPARIVSTIAPGQFRVATDEEGNHTAQATYSDAGGPMTFRFPSSGDGNAGGKPAPKKTKPFNPGAGAAAPIPETAPAT